MKAGINTAPSIRLHGVNCHSFEDVGMLGFRDIQTGNEENCTRRPFNVYLVRLTVHPSFIFALRKLH